MFREMRRKRQSIQADKCISILRQATAGVLGILGDEDYPYTVPLSHVYHDNKLFFHSALSGHKLDAIAKNDKCSYCVISEDKIVPHEYTTYFQSVIVFGKIHIITDETQKRHALEIFAERFSPDHKEGRLNEIDKLFDNTNVLELSIEHISGKESIELVKGRKH